MDTATDVLVRCLTREKRVVVLGGLAVIAHGLSRSTYDGDIWLEPMESSEAWCGFLETICQSFDGVTLNRLPGWVPVSGNDLVDAVEETNMIRILGLDCPLDVFRKPKEIEIEDFDVICNPGGETG